MNFTISHLLLSNQYSNSPFLSLTRSKINHFSNFQVNRFISNIFYTNNKIPTFKLQNSKFSKTLSSPLYFTSLSINNSQYSSTLELYDNSVVLNCFFEYCTSNSKGGAIEASREEIILTVSNCNFLHCLANQNGGGIYCRGSSVKIKNSCFANCTAYSFGQAFSIETRNGCLLELNDTIAFRCSTQEKRRNAAAFHTSNVDLILTYNNQTRCKTFKSSAAMSLFMAVFRSFTKCNIINCSSSSILEFTYAREDIQFDHINIIKNTAESNSPILVVSRNTMIYECYIEGNTKPFYDRTPGPPLTVTFEKCYYDSLGIKEESEVVTHQCNHIGANDFPFSVSPRGKNYCVYLGKAPNNMFDGFQPVIFLIISGAIILSHILIIHPRLIFEVFSQLISGNNKQKLRRRKAARKAAALLE